MSSNEEPTNEPTNQIVEQINAPANPADEPAATEPEVQPEAEVSAEEGIYTETPPELVVVSGLSDEFLRLVAVEARAKADEVKAKVNPTNIFALKYDALAQAAEDLIALAAARGHRGIPEVS